MSRLRIDYAPRKTRVWAPYALLCVAAAFAMDVGYTAFGMSGSGDTPADAATRVPVAAKENGREDARTELAAANEIVEQLDTPWPMLFGSLERANNDDVALLGLQPDREHGQLQLTGEAKTYPDVLAYVARLKAEKVFSNVYLASTDVRQDDPQRPIAFAIAASWERSQ